MIKVNCDKCGKILKFKGALIFSPPVDDKTYGDLCTKYHICGACYNKLIEWLKNGK